MSVYAKDKADLFEKALQSIFNNTLQPDHIVLVIDGPLNDELENIISKHQTHDKLKVVRLGVNQGLANALNAGLQHIQTEWVSRADSDDFNLPDRFLQTYNHVVNHPDIDIISSHILEVDSSGSPIAERRLPEHDQDIKKFALSRNPFNHMATSYRLSLVKRCGGYPLVHLKEDYALWCHMFQFGAKGYNLQSVQVYATAGRDMYKRRGGWRYAKAEYEMQRILVQTGLKRPLHALLDGITRAAVYLLPSTARGYVYEKFLRHSIESQNMT